MIGRFGLSPNRDMELAHVSGSKIVQIEIEVLNRSRRFDHDSVAHEGRRSFRMVPGEVDVRERSIVIEVRGDDVVWPRKSTMADHPVRAARRVAAELALELA